MQFLMTFLEGNGEDVSAELLRLTQTHLACELAKLSRLGSVRRRDGVLGLCLCSIEAAFRVSTLMAELVD